MDDLSRNTCALLNRDGERIARGRYEFSADKSGAKFTPASTVTPEEMAAVAFLWPDGEDRIPVVDVRPDDDTRHFHMTVQPQV